MDFNPVKLKPQEEVVTEVKPDAVDDGDILTDHARACLGLLDTMRNAGEKLSLELQHLCSNIDNFAADCDADVVFATEQVQTCCDELKVARGKEEKLFDDNKTLVEGMEALRLDNEQLKEKLKAVGDIFMKST